MLYNSLYLRGPICTSGNILLVLAESLERVEATRSSSPGLAAKLRVQMRRIDKCMQQLSQRNPEGGLSMIGRTLISERFGILQMNLTDSLEVSTAKRNVVFDGPTSGRHDGNSLDKWFRSLGVKFSHESATRLEILEYCSVYTSKRFVQQLAALPWARRRLNPHKSPDPDHLVWVIWANGPTDNTCCMGALLWPMSRSAASCYGLVTVQGLPRNAPSLYCTSMSFFL